jgi:hypothetical protein
VFVDVLVTVGVEVKVGVFVELFVGVGVAVLVKVGVNPQALTSKLAIWTSLGW